MCLDICYVGVFLCILQHASWCLGFILINVTVFRLRKLSTYAVKSITILALTDKPTLFFGVQNSLEKRCPHMQLSKVNSMPTIRLARLASCRPSTQAMILQ